MSDQRRNVSLVNERYSDRGDSLVSTQQNKAAHWRQLASLLISFQLLPRTMDCQNVATLSDYKSQQHILSVVTFLKNLLLSHHNPIHLHRIVDDVVHLILNNLLQPWAIPALNMNFSILQLYSPIMLLGFESLF